MVSGARDREPEGCDMTETPTPFLVWAEAVPDTEYSKQFMQGMLNRMAVSFYRYGKIADAYPNDISALDSMDQRLQRYAETGNTEFLMDAANFLMIEFMHPAHRNAHYAPTDSDGSPGRTTRRGHVTDAPNGDRSTWL